MTAALIKVQFHGDTLDACGTCPEDAEVSIRRVCDNLGLSMQGQIKKLQAQPWATVNFKLMVAEDGKPREVATIPLKKLPMWLGNIQTSRIKQEYREKLAQYQNECADVLARHFLRIPAAPEPVERLLGRLEHLQQQVDRLAATLAAPQPLLAPVVARWTVRNRMEFLGYMMPREARRKVHRIAVGLTESHSDEPLCQSGGMGGGGPTYWTPGNVDHLDKAIRQVWGMLEAKRLKDECRQPTIPFDARKAS